MLNLGHPFRDCRHAGRSHQTAEQRFSVFGQQQGTFSPVDAGLADDGQLCATTFRFQTGQPLPHSLSGDSTRGMGIGLSVCQSIIKAHDGFFAAGNDPEGGAVFRFGLPMEEIKDE